MSVAKRRTGFRWLSEKFILAIHEEQLAEHGGLSGLRDENLLASALARAQNLAGYGKPTVHECAAAYAFGIVRNHPFNDGNKRTALVAAGLFLLLNGVRLTATQAQAVISIQTLAAGQMDEVSFAQWLQAHSTFR